MFYCSKGNASCYLPLFLEMAFCRTWCVPLISCCSAKRGAHFSAEANYISEKCVCVFLSVLCPSVLQSTEIPVNVLEIRSYRMLLTAILSSLWKDWLTAWLRAVCLPAFTCELQITARQHRACSRQRQGFTLSSVPRGCLWVLCHMTLTEIDPLRISRSCCSAQRFLWCCCRHLREKKRNSLPSIWLSDNDPEQQLFLNRIRYRSRDPANSALQQSVFYKRFPAVSTRFVE